LFVVTSTRGSHSCNSQFNLCVLVSKWTETTHLRVPQRMLTSSREMDEWKNLLLTDYLSALGTLVLGRLHVIAATDRGSVFTWGGDAAGQLGHGRGGIEKKHPIDVASSPPPLHVCTSSTLRVSHAPISVECLFSTTLLHGSVREGVALARLALGGSPGGGGGAAAMQRRRRRSGDRRNNSAGGGYDSPQG